MTIRPVLAVWNEADLTFKVESRFGALARRQFVNGEEYPISVVEERSSADHNHYWAAVTNAWDNIRDPATLEILSSPDLLRQWAMVQGGKWCNTTIFAPLSKQAAMKAAERAAINFRHRGRYIEIVVRHSHDEETGEENGWAVVIKEAVSQSRSEMDKETFRESKKDVLDILSGIIEVKRKDLENAAKDIENH
jgi:hypothetical protein